MTFKAAMALAALMVLVLPSEVLGVNIQLSIPGDGSALKGTVPVTVNVAPTKNLQRVELKVDGTSIGSDSSSPFVFQWDTTAVSDGQHTLTATAYYKSRQSSASLGVRVANGATPPPPPPSVPLVVLSPPEFSTVTGQVTVRAQTGIANAEWMGFYVCDGNQSYEDIALVNGVGEVVWDTTQCPNGERNMAIYVFEGGNELAHLDTFMLTVDNAAVPPPPPPPPPDPNTPVPAPIANQGYALTFADDFDVLHPDIWVDHQWWESSAPVGSIYAQDSILNIVRRRANGFPNITVSSEPHAGGTGRSFEYGYFEARMRFTQALGSGPAFWMLSTAHATNDKWPQPKCPNPDCLCSELDIVEAHGNKTLATGALHRNTGDFYGVQNEFKWGIVSDGVQLGPDWHVYSALWTPEKVRWYLDGVFKFEQPTWDSTHQPMHLLFYNWDTPWEDNVAGPTSPDELRTEVDWVRVWQQ